MDDLNLNSLDRFSKQPGALLLEQFGSCEVPAGCGGAVLRWRNPNDGLPLVFSTVVDANVTIFVDGRPSLGGHVIVPNGDHVVAAHFTKLNPHTGPLLFCAYDATAARRRWDRQCVLRSASDGTWMATTSCPENAEWTTADYDDSDWTVLSEQEDFDPESLESNWSWRYSGKIEEGITPLAIPSGDQLWVRKRFHLPAGE